MSILFDNGPRLRHEEFRLLRDLVNKHSGMHFDEGSMYVFERRLRERLKALSLPDFTAYYHYLRYGPNAAAEIEDAVEALVTNETYFFREEYQLRAFHRDLLPVIRDGARARGSKRIVLWSAGCSTGEEVYTLAILVAHSGLFEGWDVRVFGNDISRKVLAVARRATYPPSSFRAMPEDYARYFVKEPDGTRVHPRIRAMCQFGHINLLDREKTALVGRVDAIFCRNVLIYFDAESRKKVIDTFYERLHPGGYLLLGHSESLLHASTKFEIAHLSSDMVYRRPLQPRRPTAGGGEGEGSAR